MSPRPHIALNGHLLSGESSYRSAGIHGYLYNTLIRLPDAAPEMDFTVMVGRGPTLEGLRMGKQVSLLSTERPVVRIFWEQLLAPLALARLKPALLHGMAFTTPLLWHGTSVVTIFDMSFMRYPDRLTRGRRWYLTWFTRLSARRAKRVIAISESGRQEIAALLGLDPARIDVALPGVSADFKPFPAAEVAGFRTRMGLPERFILHVGTLEPRKNLETLIRAYAGLSQRDQVKLVLVGAKGWQTGPFFQLIEELGLTLDVILPGYSTPGELPLWYASAEVFAFPSLYEGFGLPVLEAMACGAPVVVSNTTSLPEIVGNDGLQVDPLDVEAWREALTGLLDDPVRRADLSARGRERASHFSWEQTAWQTVASYRAALGSEAHE
jgi:glycosyltransferase involved in cell wall biosynthesis